MLHIVFVLALLSLEYANSQPVEEFHAHGPMEFHDLAMGAFLELRKENPKENLSHDSTFMQQASAHAVKRLSRPPDENFELHKLDLTGADSGDGIEKVLELPSPEGKDQILSSAVNSQGKSSGAAGSGGELISAHDAKASALVFNEEIGLGAISKTGALPLGSDGEWLELAEKKLKKDASLDYQALLWEKGSEVAERAQIQRGGLNITLEQELLTKMEEWFATGGGKLQFVKPSVTREGGFQLIAEEDILVGDAFVSVPMKLIMCRQTARNVVISNRGKYLGDELQKTFEKDEMWGMTVFLLHEYYKEVNGKGSKWGPFIRTLRSRFLTTQALHAVRGTIAAHLSAKWSKDSDAFMWWSVGINGPCSPTTGICKTKPLERTGESRFNIHQIRWAYWVVKQNAVKVKQMSTGLEFIALIPYYNMVEKMLGTGGGVTFDLDGSISLRVGQAHEEGVTVKASPGNMSDSEYFMRYLRVPPVPNPHTEIKLSLPGVLPMGSKFHYCMKGDRKERNRDECKAAYRSESMFWKSKVLTEWRQMMNLPPRMQELRMWATRLHLYGGKEEMALLSSANKAIAGLPLSEDQMPAEEQLMLLGLARDSNEAALILSGNGNNPDSGASAAAADRPPPQLYSAPDPEEDHEAQRGMENLALLAVQAQNVISSGNAVLNATQAVLNQTKDFFVHGVLPKAGLDDLDMFLLKKIGMLAHCGFENDMKIIYGNVTEELMCAMRVHLMNESEVHVFCPKEARVWEDSCTNVEFMNYTAISEPNELNVINALQGSIDGLLASYPTTWEEDQRILKNHEEKERSDASTTSTTSTGEEAEMGPVMIAAVKLRSREKEILHDALHFLEGHEAGVRNGSVPFQLELKAQERVEADIREEEHKKFMKEIQDRAKDGPALATLEVDMGAGKPKQNLTLEEGRDLKQTVLLFCQTHGVKANFVQTLEDALRQRVKSPDPLLLMMGAIISTGDRKILAIPEGSNYTVETGVFCTRYDSSRNPIDSDWCQALLKRVEERLNSNAFQRRVLLVVPVDAPDTRKLKLVIREGEQHDILQIVSDFFELYHIPQYSVNMMANEVIKRLPAVVTQVPVGLHSRRQVAAKFSMGDNVTAVVEAFANFYELEETAKIAIMKRARYGMAPGTFMAE